MGRAFAIAEKKIESRRKGESGERKRVGEGTEKEKREKRGAFHHDALFYFAQLVIFSSESFLFWADLVPCWWIFVNI